MAFRSKKIKNEQGVFINKPKTCSFCGEVKAFHSIHGGSVGFKYGGGKKACHVCIKALHKEEEKMKVKVKDWGYRSSGERQAMRSFGIR
ncbi:hypothetical protein [Bacillus pumilus]|uniref:hypothetical protein n=1 Tax=Bacillus pumilus TaxID=1408 RepID=UPI0011A46D34|nr:hypothetical protein [Bacillus pumilus]